MMFVVCVVVSNEVAARVLPSENGLTDQKNVFTFGGVGGYSGIGNNGMPFGGIGGGVGTSGGPGGNMGAGGIIGTGPNGGLTGVYGTVPGGVGTFNFPGVGAGAGAGTLPNP